MCFSSHSPSDLPGKWPLKSVCTCAKVSFCIYMYIAFKHMTPVIFEKDDDYNGHIDFITAASVRT